MNETIEKLLESIDSTLSTLEKKEASEASFKQVREVLETKIAEWGQEWTKEQSEREAALAKAEQRIQELEKTSQKVAELETQIKKITEAALNQQQEMDFQTRMNAIASEFELSEDELKIVTKKIKGMSEASYTEWYDEFSVFASSKKKANIEASKNELEQKISDLEQKLKEKETSNASAANDSVDTDDAGGNTEEILDKVKEKDNQGVANAQTPSNEEPNLLTQFNEGFKGSIKIKY